MEQLFIPERIKIGFVSRDDTYTKKLAYVIYWDLQNRLRKEKSWNSWRDETIEPKDFNNEPTEGFVLNKGVGGQRCSHSWNARNEYIRVYDPRDFEFEISVANLLFILRECDCSRGKGLEGKFVYAWDGKELVLLPEISQDYKKSKDFTGLQTLSVKSKELIKGATYETKNQNDVVYLGKFDYHYIVKPDGYTKKEKSGGVYKRHIFYNNNFLFLDSLKTLARLKSDNVVPNYAELVDKYFKSEHGSKIVSLFTKSYKPEPKTYPVNCWVYLDGNDYLQCYNEYKWNSDAISRIVQQYRISLKNGIITVKDDVANFYPKGSRPTSYQYQNISHSTEWVDPTNQKLYAKLESGSEFVVDGYYGLKSDKLIITEEML